jgi:hypothetical protein
MFGSFIRLVPAFVLVVSLGCADGSAPDASGSEWPLASADLSPVSDSLPEADTASSEGVSASVDSDVIEGAVPLAEGSANADPAAAVGDAPSPVLPTPREFSDFPDARFPRPEHVRGIYVNAWAAGSNARMTELIGLARRTEVNAFVIDIKDASGYVSHRTEVPLAVEIGATEERRIRDLPALLDRLRAEGIYPIARIVVVKDPILSKSRPEFAVQDTAGGVWIDSKDIIWLNPFSEGMWAYPVALAREVAEMGFPEIQWDYIRFPDAPQSDMERAVFVGSEGRERVDAIRGFLSFAREELSDLPVRSTVDVFGVTTSFRRDVGIGQLWETFIDVVDVALPMVYPSHYWEGSFSIDEPNAYPYEIVRRALQDAVRRSTPVAGAGLTRPWLQDFSLGQPIYSGAEVRAQIQATYDAGIQEWVLWNASSRYTESALEPIGGFEREPLMRVAGVLAPVSRRQEVIDSVAALPLPQPESVVVESVAVDSVSVDSRAGDSAIGGSVLRDSLVVDMSADTVRRPRH